MGKDSRFIVAGIKSWNRKVFDEVISRFPGDWYFISDAKQLTSKYVFDINPRYIFFLHWSDKVPIEIFGKYECVCLHMTDVPFGRGGSPLQNLIIRGHKNTKVTALRMVQDFDAGPVYIKKELGLEGTAEEIYVRATYLSAEMIKYIIDEKPEPIPQCGDPVIFKRRKPSQSKIKKTKDLQSLHDFIRMLDAPGYPKAFFEYEGYRYELSKSKLENDKLIAEVVIKYPFKL